MSITCALTGKSLLQPVYHSGGNRSITSLSKIYQGPTVIYYNEAIGHLQTREIESIDKYYDEQYAFFNESDEDDVLYQVKDGKKIFRQQHQVETLSAKVKFYPGMQILDYGCAKGTVLKRLALQYPDIVPHLFDVSRMYEELWKKFIQPENFSSYQTPPEWRKKFDLVTSFFAFEHAPDPVKELSSIRALLKSNGLVYLIVPNVYENTGDFIVADHVHHYSESSLRYLLSRGGFETLEIDARSHFAAFIAVGRKADSQSLEPALDPARLAETHRESAAIAKYWTGLQAVIRKNEESVGEAKAAIYGAGVYGNFIATCLKNMEGVSCFIDQNPLLEGKMVQDKPILRPDQLPGEVRTIYVGLNPKTARASMEAIRAWEGRPLTFFYL